MLHVDALNYTPCMFFLVHELTHTCTLDRETKIVLAALYIYSIIIVLNQEAQIFFRI